MKNPINRKGDTLFPHVPRPRPAGVNLRPSVPRPRPAGVNLKSNPGKVGAAIGVAALATFGAAAEKYSQYKQNNLNAALDTKMGVGYERVMAQRMGRPDWYYGPSDVGMPGG